MLGIRGRSKLCRICDCFIAIAIICWILFTSLHIEISSQYVQDLAQFIPHSQKAPLNDTSFGEMGLRGRKLLDLMHQRETSCSWRLPWQTHGLEQAIERLAVSLFPFLQTPSRPQDSSPFKTLRMRYKPGSKGIVIPAGKSNFPFAASLILALRNVHGVKLPIEIAFAGDDDLPCEYRRALTELTPNVDMLDVTRVLNDSTIDLRSGGWAIKPFAALASSLEQVIVVDADAVFVQSPAHAFSDPGYKQTGTLFFHDRILSSDADPKRQKFFEDNMKLLNTTVPPASPFVLNKSFTDYQDSGVVVYNKRKPSALVGLLNTCWQNSQQVRSRITYNMFYGDKETYWLGMALVGAFYTFEQHYSGMVGVLRDRPASGNADDGKPIQHVCGNTIAHNLDANATAPLFWYNGSLLRNKAADKITYMVPTHFMSDGHCGFVGERDFAFCCSGGTLVELSASERGVIEQSVEYAKKVDQICITT